MITTGNDCLACFMKQVLTTVKLSTDDAKLQRRLIIEVGEMLRDFPEEKPPPVNALRYYRHIAEHTGVEDPFLEIKEASNVYAQSLEGKVQESIDTAPDPLQAALRFAIAANVLDNGAQYQLDVESVMNSCQDQKPAVDHTKSLLSSLASACNLLYLGDNCGEIVLDKLLVKQLLSIGCKVTYVVRGRPIINDAVMDDAVDCGLDKLCSVMDNGSGVPGTVPSLCSPEFLSEYEKADIIISKGMGNFECLYGEEKPIFYLFTVKCSNVMDFLRRRFPKHMISIGSPMLIGPDGFSVKD